jgi:hypothetical protein
MSEVKPVDLDAMDKLILEVTANGGQYSQEFENWKWRHRRNWAAIKSEVEAIRARVSEMDAKQLKWTTEKPTKEGWYWMNQGVDSTKVMKIKKDSRGHLFLDGAVYRAYLLEMGGLTKWAGPIKEPQEGAQT